MTDRSHRRVVRFYLLAVGLSWAAWASLTVSALGWGEATPSPYLHLVGGLGPAAAALVLCGFEGRRALWRIARRSVSAPPIWLLIAIGGPLLVCLGAAAALAALGYHVDLTAIGRNSEYPALGITSYALASLIAYGFGEEVGWRGYALPRLQHDWSAARATLVVAAGWAVWHLPLFAFSPGLREMGPIEIVGWGISILSGAFLMTWIFNASGGSVLAVAIFHSVLDILMGSPTGAPLQTAMGAIITVAGFTIPFRFRLGDLPRSPRVTEPPLGEPEATS